MLAFGFTIFVGAFLLFQVQPLMGKYLLPWFGGGPAVWTTCMLFFQVFLLGGYAYAHLLTRCFQPRGQARVQLGLLLLALASLPIVPGEVWKTRGHEHPLPAILLLLACNVGLAYLVLASTGPLLQAWSKSYQGLTSPYRLYALSNLGSLLGLVTYPLVFEAHFSRQVQARIWEGGLVLYTIGCGFCAIRLCRPGTMSNAIELSPAAGAPKRSLPEEPGTTAAKLLRRLQWLLWPACASVLLLAVTNKLCLDVAAVPLLWVLPLGVYLLSFTICFDNPRWYWRRPFTVVLGLSLACLCWALFQGWSWPFWAQVSVYVAGLLVCCMVCHGELYRLRPRHEALTEFYLLVAAGGALGGLFVSLVAPMVFTNYYELHWGLAMCGLLLVSGRTLEAVRLLPTAFSGEESPDNDTHTATWAPRDWRRLSVAVLWLCFLGLATTLWLQARRPGTAIVHKSRNFYGVLTVFEHRKDEPTGHHFLLQHGRITHGLQFVDPQLQDWPTSYYGAESGIGLAFKVLGSSPRRIGVVGLGTGTLAAYGRPGDYLHFYEINPRVRSLATSQFTYLTKCRAECEVTLGDARLSLEAERAQDFDLLALDAFSSDSVPIHLLTRQAFELYLRHLKPSGIIAVHTSNHFLDLEPVVTTLARHLHLQLAVIDQDPAREQWWIYASSWILLSRDDQVLNQPAIASASKSQNSRPREGRLWTDDFSSVFQILR